MMLLHLLLFPNMGYINVWAVKHAVYNISMVCKCLQYAGRYIVGVCITSPVKHMFTIWNCNN